MTRHLETRTLLASLLVFVLASPGSAQTVFPVAATGSAENTSKIYDITGSHSVIVSHTTYAAMRNSEPDSPVDGLHGPCFGFMEIKEGLLSGDGYCNYDDADGERAVIQWTATSLGEGGEIRGEWTLIGGSGKWVGATGGGEFESLTARKTGRTTNTILGEVALK